ncbi:MAG TPA: glycosyltransferase, partial [Candidatus Paceibacterota bacterium]|nr:glycosyltransferase [Candidatus Paceibacterota bacterium]
MAKEPDHPLLSIILPVLNAEHFLPDTLAAIERQTFKDWEVVAMDGGSKDRTLAILRAFGAKGHSVQISSEPDESVWHAIWKGANKARGDFLCILPASDAYASDKWLENAVSKLSSDETISLVWGVPFAMDENGKVIGPAYVYGHFLPDRPLGEGADVVVKLFDKLNIFRPGGARRLWSKLNILNLKTAWHALKSEAIPQKTDWYEYWEKTGTVFPDAGMCVSRRVFLEACPPYVPGSHAPDAQTEYGFNFNFHTKGYLAFGLAEPANLMRTHAGQRTDKVQVLNDKAREDYLKRVRDYATRPEKNVVVFRDRAGHQLSRNVRLHLGCGEKYLEGYVNIDFPEGEHTVMKPKADLVADIRTLSYPENSVDEIRSHHVFEHFSRAEALKLLSRWRKWLKPGGLLVVETPDFSTSALFFNLSFSMRRKFQLSRHIFGSQEAKWALHQDHWDKRKFKFVLGALGFESLRVRRYWNGLARHAEKIPKLGGLFRRLPEPLYLPVLNVLGNILPESFYERYGSNKMPNILVTARKSDVRSLDERAAVKKILAMHLTGR